MSNKDKTLLTAEGKMLLSVSETRGEIRKRFFHDMAIVAKIISAISSGSAEEINSTAFVGP